MQNKVQNIQAVIVRKEVMEIFLGFFPIWKIPDFFIQIVA